MDDNVLYILNNELSGNVKEALNIAAQAIYFNDNSDYLSALWDVVYYLLDGKVSDDAGGSFISELVRHLNPNWDSESQ